MKSDNSLVDAYDVYQQLMVYWADILQDDCYMVSHDGWMLTYSAAKKNPTYEDYVCDLLPFPIVLNTYFGKELGIIDELKSKSEGFASELQQLIDTAIEELDDPDEDEVKAAAANVKKTAPYKSLDKKKKDVDKDIKQKKEELTKQVISTYEHFTSNKDVADLVVNKKWIATLVDAFNSTMTQITQSLTADVITLAERYEQTLGGLSPERRPPSLELPSDSCSLTHVERKPITLCPINPSYPPLPISSSPQRLSASFAITWPLVR